LKFGKEKLKNCTADEKAITCRKADDLFKDKFAAMVGDGEGAKNFFTDMDKDARGKFESGFAEKTKKAAKSLAARLLTKVDQVEGEAHNDYNEFGWNR